MFALLAVAVTAAPLVPVDAEAHPSPDRSGLLFIVPGYALTAFGSTVALLGGLLAALYAATPSSCGIDPCARIGGNDAGWLTLAFGLGAMFLVGLPALLEGYRERYFSPASSPEPG
jgi:hypothetical protein